MPYIVNFGGYDYPDEYSTEEEAYEAGLEMQSAFNQGSIDLYGMNPGDFIEEATGDDGFEVKEV